MGKLFKYVRGSTFGDRKKNNEKVISFPKWIISSRRTVSLDARYRVSKTDIVPVYPSLETALAEGG